jgi:hypothetical protein
MDRDYFIAATGRRLKETAGQKGRDRIAAFVQLIS